MTGGDWVQVWQLYTGVLGLWALKPYLQEVLELSPSLRKLLNLHHLAGNPVNQLNETINYNEHFAWSFDTDYDQSYGEGLEKGLPSPILYVAEKFTTQSACGVHRQYRISGHYASLMLW